MATGPAPLVGLWAHRWGDLAGRTGVGRYALELAAALAEHVGPLRYERRGGREPEPPTGAPALRTSWPPRQALHAAWLGLGAPRLERVAPPVDLLHPLFPSFPVPTKAALVATIHDVMVLDHPGWYPSGERRAVAAATRRLAERADRIVTGAEHAADQIGDRLGAPRDRIVVIPHGLNPLLTPDGPSHVPASGSPYVVAVGAVTDRKNLGVVVDALAGVGGVDLVLVGPEGPASAALAARVDQRSLGGRVHHLGRRPDDQLAALLRGALALVHPSLDEGYGLPPLEAMATGTPALVARSGALPEVVGDAAPVLDPHDPDAWAGEVTRLRDDPDHRAALVALGLAHVAGRTWAATAAATAAVHEAVLRERGAL